MKFFVSSHDHPAPPTAVVGAALVGVVLVGADVGPLDFMTAAAVHLPLQAASASFLHFS
jgi:hypothetical protein